MNHAIGNNQKYLFTNLLFQAIVHEKTCEIKFCSLDKFLRSCWLKQITGAFDTKTLLFVGLDASLHVRATCETEVSHKFYFIPPKTSGMHMSVYCIFCPWRRRIILAEKHFYEQGSMTAYRTK